MIVHTWSTPGPHPQPLVALLPFLLQLQIQGLAPDLEGKCLNIMMRWMGEGMGEGMGVGMGEGMGQEMGEGMGLGMGEGMGE